MECPDPALSERANRRGFTHVIFVVCFTLREEWLGSIELSLSVTPLHGSQEYLPVLSPKEFPWGAVYVFSIDAPFCQLLERAYPDRAERKPLQQSESAAHNPQ
jgi:hypothetical protein